MMHMVSKENPSSKPTTLQALPGSSNDSDDSLNHVPLALAQKSSKATTKKPITTTKKSKTTKKPKATTKRPKATTKKPITTTKKSKTTKEPKGMAKKIFQKNYQKTKEKKAR